MAQGPIIIIDDDVDDHFIFEEVCKKLDDQHTLKFFRNAVLALEYLRTTKDKPFLIFCDINMPQMSGLELRRTIDKDDELKRKCIPFIFFTTAASKPQVMEAYDLTVQGFFIKESSFDDLERTIALIFGYWQKCRHPNAYF
jgi:CheY-like chemotaxis protein